MKPRKIALLSVLVVLLSAATIIYAAESASFIVNMFTAGLQGSPANSSSYQARSLLTPFQPGSSMAQSASYSANIGFFSNIPAAASIDAHDIYPRSSAPGSIIRFYISASNALSVWATLALPNGSSERLTLVNNGSAYYVASLTGRYDVVFYANNSAGAAVNATDYFVIAVTPAAVPPVGGGAITCTYIWDCSPWSICYNGNQTRTCNNTGTCTGISGKPEEERVCSEALFDVSIKLDNMELTENETLTFDVNLTETKSVEKIDVQVKYMILGQNGSELFSQAETRAVEKNLSYRKTIDLKLGEGRYTLRVDILYGFQQKAYAEQGFIVKGREIEVIPPAAPEAPFGFIFAVIVASALLAAALAAIALLLMKRRRREPAEAIKTPLPPAARKKPRKAKKARKAKARKMTSKAKPRKAGKKPRKAKAGKRARKPAAAKGRRRKRRAGGRRRR